MLRDQLLAISNGNPIDAAARFAFELMQDDPAILKAGYTRDNALLSAYEMFPEISDNAYWRIGTALDGLLEEGQDGARRGSTARGGAS